MTTDQPPHDDLPIDVSEIIIECTSVDEVDHRLDIEIPAKLIKRFQKKIKKAGQQVDSEQIVSALVKLGLDEALRKQDFNAVWGPRPFGDPSTWRLSKDKPLQFTFMIDDRPDVTWPPFEQIEITRPVLEIDDQLINAELDQQKIVEGPRIPWDGPIKPGLEILLDLQLTGLDEDQTLDIKDVTVLVPEGNVEAVIAGMPVPEFAKLVEGAATGEEIVVDLAVPDELAGELGRDTAVLTLMVRKAWSIEPATIEQLVETYGSRNEQVLRQQIRLSLKAKADQDQQQIMLSQFFEMVSERVNIPVPNQVVDHIIQQRAEATRQHLVKDGQSEQEIDDYLKKQHPEWFEQALHQTRCRGVVNMLARQEQIKVTESEVQDVLNAMAINRGIRPEQMRREAIEKDMLSGLSFRCLQIKTFEHFQSQLTITDMPADEWAAEHQVDQD